MDIFIENSTEDDAMIKVSPGGIGKAYKDAGPMDPKGLAEPPASAATKTIVKAKSSQKLSLPSSPSYVVHFMVPVEVGSHSVTSGTIKGLKLTGGKKRYAIEEIKNGGRRPKA